MVAPTVAGRYDGQGRRLLLDGWADGAEASAQDRLGRMQAHTRLQAGQAVRVRIVSRRPSADDPVHLRWYANGKLLFARTDTPALQQGWFALRTAASHLQVHQFEVLRCRTP